MIYKYSFVIPHKNSKEYLLRCVRSIPLQPAIEIIVVDDNSDESQKPYFDQGNIKVIYLNQNESNGAGHARNVGLSNVLGEWVLFPDCDDYYVEGFLSKLEPYTTSEFDIVYFNSLYKDGETGELLPPLTFNEDFKNFDGSRATTDAIKFKHNSPWTKMIRRDFILRHDLRFEETVNGNDIFFSMSAGYCANRIGIIKDPLYVYLRNSNSITKKKLTAKESFCVIKHNVQLNHFYKHIGYEKWKKNVKKMTLYYIKLCGLSFLFFLIVRTYHLFNSRNALISFVELKKNIANQKLVQ